MVKFKLIKNKGQKRPTENYYVQYGKTIIFVFPDYIDLKYMKTIVKLLNLYPKTISKPDILK